MDGWGVCGVQGPCVQTVMVATISSETKVTFRFYNNLDNVWIVVLFRQSLNGCFGNKFGIVWMVVLEEIWASFAWMVDQQQFGHRLSVFIWATMWTSFEWVFWQQFGNRSVTFLTTMLTSFQWLFWQQFGHPSVRSSCFDINMDIGSSSNLGIV